MTAHEETPHRFNFFQRVRLSIFPGPRYPAKERHGYRRLFNSLLLHFRPRTVDARTLRFSLTWGLGGMAAVLIFLLLGTGVLLKFFYDPFPGRAYESILYLRDDVTFGRLIRNLHHWSANGLLIVVFLHFLRVFFTGAFHPPRQFNWVIGMGIFLTVLFSNFTGYLLPWDQLSFWAVTICGNMLEYIPWLGHPLQQLLLGGLEVGTDTLAKFYAIHTAILPALILMLLPFHFWRVRKAGGLVIPRPPNEAHESQRQPVDGIPNLILREVVVALVLIAFMLVFSMLVEAPLGSKANPGLSPNPTRAPWYFAGFQEMIMHFHPLFSLFIIPVLTLIFLTGLPYFNYESNTAGVWFGSFKGRRAARFAAVAAMVATPAGILFSEQVIDFAGWLPGVPTVITGGLIPFVCVSAVIAGFYFLIKNRFAATGNDAIQAVFMLLLVAFLILTATGIWFRGQEMRLMWPWEVHIKGL